MVRYNFLHCSDDITVDAGSRLDFKSGLSLMRCVTL